MADLKIYTWSHDRGCWMGDPPRDHEVNTPPIRHLLDQVEEHLPSAILDEWTASYTLVPGDVLDGTWDRDILYPQ